MRTSESLAEIAKAVAGGRAILASELDEDRLFIEFPNLLDLSVRRFREIGRSRIDLFRYRDSAAPKGTLAHYHVLDSEEREVVIDLVRQDRRLAAERQVVSAIVERAPAAMQTV